MTSTKNGSAVVYGSKASQRGLPMRHPASAGFRRPGRGARQRRQFHLPGAPGPLDFSASAGYAYIRSATDTGTASACGDNFTTSVLDTGAARACGNSFATSVLNTGSEHSRVCHAIATTHAYGFSDPADMTLEERCLLSTYTVTVTSGYGVGSLWYGVEYATAGETINFSPSARNDTLPAEAVLSANNVTINGSTSGGEVYLHLDGFGYNFFGVTGTGDTFENLLTDGGSAPPNESGGFVVFVGTNPNSTLNINHCTIEGTLGGSTAIGGVNPTVTLSYDAWLDNAGRFGDVQWNPTTGGTLNADHDDFNGDQGFTPLGPTAIGLFLNGTATATINIDYGTFLYGTDGFDIYAQVNSGATPNVYVTDSYFNLYGATNGGAFASISQSGALSGTYMSFSSCTVTGATSQYGAVTVESTGSTLLNSDNIEGNATTGVYVYGNATYMNVGLYNSDVTGNTPSTASGGGVGAGLGSTDFLQLINDNVLNNTANGIGADGGGLNYGALSAGETSNLQIYSCLFSGNSAKNLGGGVYVATAYTPTVLADNDVFYGNTNSDLYGPFELTYSDYGLPTGLVLASGSGANLSGVNPLISKTVTLPGSPGDPNSGTFGSEYEFKSTSQVTTAGDPNLDSAPSPFNLDIVGTVRKAGTTTGKFMGPCVVPYTGATPSTASALATDVVLGTGVLDFFPSAKSRLLAEFA